MPPRVAPVHPPPIDSDSVFYVHPSEGPSSVTVTPHLNGSNTSTGLTQDEYTQLVSLLQQANLFASVSQPTSTTPSNNASVSNVIHEGNSPHDASTSGNNSFSKLVLNLVIGF
jgi:hypothetical protein